MDKQEALTPIQNLGFLISAIRCGVEFDEHCQRAADALLAHLSDPGYVRVPVVPSESQWGGLARDIMMWLDFGGRRTGSALYEHLSCLEIEAPQWLRDEVPNIDHVPSKGTRCAIIYRAMIEDHLAAATKGASHD